MKLIAHFFSFLFHPIFILIYILFITLLVNPYAFGYNDVKEARDLLLFNLLIVVPIPVLSIILLRGLGLTTSLQLKSRQERIGPYLITGIVYLSLYVQLARTQSTGIYQAAVLGALIIIFGGFFANNFFKISMHSAGAGALMAFVAVLVLRFSDRSFELDVFNQTQFIIPTALLLPIVVLLGGVICTSRTILKAHSLQEVYAGAVLGIMSQLIAFNIVI